MKLSGRDSTGKRHYQTVDGINMDKLNSHVSGQIMIISDSDFQIHKLIDLAHLGVRKLHMLVWLPFVHILHVYWPHGFPQLPPVAGCPQPSEPNGPCARSARTPPSFQDGYGRLEDLRTAQLSNCLTVYLSVCRSICLPICLSICLSVYLSDCLSVCLSNCLYINLSNLI